MSYSPEQLKKAFVTVLNERVPDLSKIPDHVFSERFEKKMKKLIAREAAHPWAVSHTAVKNLIIAAIVIILMIAMCFSVSGIREAIFNFFIKHFDAYNEIVFNESPSDSESIIVEYCITTLPEGFNLTKKTSRDYFVRWEYADSNQNWIVLSQKIITKDQQLIIDNERNTENIVVIEGIAIYCSANQNAVTLAWKNEQYEFWLEIGISNFTIEEALDIYNSITPINDS